MDWPLTSHTDGDFNIALGVSRPFRDQKALLRAVQGNSSRSGGNFPGCLLRVSLETVTTDTEEC